MSISMEAPAEQVEKKTWMATLRTRGDHPYLFPLLLVLIGVLVRLPFMLSTGAVLWPDSIQYYNAAAALIEQGTFTRISIYHTPLYPLFLSVFLAFGRTPAAGTIILAAQNLIGIATVLLLYWTGIKIAGKVPSFIAALLLSVHPLLVYYERVIQTEILFVFLFMVLIAVLQRLLSVPSTLSAVVCGITSALVTLTRPVALYLPAGFALLLILRDRGIRKAALLLVVYAVILAPWIFFNHYQKGFWGVSQGAGVNLFLKVYEVAGIQPVEDSKYPQVRRIYESVKVRSRDTHVYWEVRKLLYGRTHSEARTDELMLRFAIEGLFSNPFPYLSVTLRNFAAFFLNARNSVNVCTFEKGPVPCAGTARLVTQAFPFVDGSEYPALSSSAAGFLRDFQIPMWIFVLASIYGAAALWRREPEQRSLIVAATFTAFYFALIVSALNMPEDRYRLPLDPLFFLYGVYGACHLLQNIMRRYRRADE